MQKDIKLRNNNSGAIYGRFQAIVLDDRNQ